MMRRFLPLLLLCACSGGADTTVVVVTLESQPGVPPPSEVSVEGPPTLVVMNMLLYTGRAIVWLIDARIFMLSVTDTEKSMFGNQL